MEVKDAVFGFYLSPSSAVYIPKEGTETKKMKDGTIIKVPKYMYHPLVDDRHDHKDALETQLRDARTRNTASAP